MVDAHVTEEPGCRVCGSVPTRTVTIRRHVGMVLMQRFVKVRAPLCRDCGVNTVKAFTLRTLWQGWWGYISFFVNWFVIAANLDALLKLRRLPQPRPAAVADAVSSERWRSAFSDPTFERNVREPD